MRHGRTYEKGKPWTQRHRVWLAEQVFEQPVHQIVFQDYVEAIFTAQDRRDQLVARITALVPSWSMGPLVRRCVGSRTELLRTLAASGGEESAILRVRSFKPKWRADPEGAENYTFATAL